MLKRGSGYLGISPGDNNEHCQHQQCLLSRIEIFQLLQNICETWLVLSFFSGQRNTGGVNHACACLVHQTNLYREQPNRLGDFCLLKASSALCECLTQIYPCAQVWTMFYLHNKQVATCSEIQAIETRNYCGASILQPKINLRVAIHVKSSCFSPVNTHKTGCME